MSAKYKWGILAPGNITHRFAKGLAQAPDAVKYAVGSRDLGRAKKFADEYGFERAYGSYEELVSDAEVDIVYVAPPHPQHMECTMLCLDHKKAVVCEKPFAVNADQASRMIGCAKKNGVFLMECMWTRFLPSVVKTRELIAGGAIGRVRHINADFGFRAEPDPNSRLFAPNSAGGSLLDVGVYNISFCGMIYGKQPDSIKSHMEIGGTGVDEVASALLSYGEGQTAFVMSAVRLSTNHEAVIYGEEGFIKLPSYWNGKSLILSNGDGKREFDFPYEASGFQFEAIEAMACIGRGLTESPVMPLAETLAVIKTLDKIRAAHDLRYPFERNEGVQ